MRSILIFSSLYLPHLGGVERYTSNLAHHLMKLGNKVVVITSKMANELEEEKIDEVEIVRLKSFNFLNGRFPIYNFVNRNKDLRNLKRFSPDLVIVNTRYYPLSLLGVQLANKLKVKCILIDHSTGHISFNSKFLDSISERYEHFMTSRFKKYDVDFYGVSKNVSLWLKHFQIKSKGEIYNAVDLDMIEQLKKQNHCKLRNFPLESYSEIICYTGRLIKEKGVLELIEGFQIYQKEHNSCLVIAGDGPLMERIKQIQCSNLYILGKLTFEQVISLLSRSNIFCFPTAYPEGFPTSLLEAAACRCYLISTDKGGARELIRNDNYGCILEDNKPQTIAKALEGYSKLKNIDSILENAYNTVKYEFNWPVVAEKVSHMV